MTLDEQLELARSREAEAKTAVDEIEAHMLRLERQLAALETDRRAAASEYQRRLGDRKQLEEDRQQLRLRPGEVRR